MNSPEPISTSVKATPAVRLRAAVFVLSSLWGVAFLAKFFGIASMQFVVIVFALPATAILILLWRWSKHHAPEVATGILVGAIGGLLGTFAYDLVRIPFALGGQRIFAPISAYGLWILATAQSSRFTDAVGWLYHFVNGITFGILYAVAMQNRHWAWAILWGFVLETIAITSPFGAVFMMRGNAPGIIAAYLGHIAYGVPLGLLVWRSRQTYAWLKTVPGIMRLGVTLVTASAILGPLLSPVLVERDSRRIPGALRVEGARLNPEWVRINRDEMVGIVNPGAASLRVRSPRTGQAIDISAGGTEYAIFNRPGIYPVFIQTGARTRSSFVIVEPVEQTR